MEEDANKNVPVIGKSLFLEHVKARRIDPTKGWLFYTHYAVDHMSPAFLKDLLMAIGKEMKAGLKYHFYRKCPITHNGRVYDDPLTSTATAVDDIDNDDDEHWIATNAPLPPKSRRQRAIQ